MALTTAALHGAAALKYVTRFTEDIFSTLISIIFIAECVKFIVKVLSRTLYNTPIIPFTFTDIYRTSDNKLARLHASV
jgi:hypothetical protein